MFAIKPGKTSEAANIISDDWSGSEHEDSGVWELSPASSAIFSSRITEKATKPRTKVIFGVFIQLST